jgi:hypothetical protein
MRYCSGFLIIIWRFQHVLVKLSNTKFRENPLNVTRVSYRVTPVFLTLGFMESQVSAKACQRFRETKMRNGGRFLLAILNLYVQIKFRVATFNADHSVTDKTQSTAASVQKLSDSAVKSASTARHRLLMCQAKRSIFQSVWS